MNINTKFIRIKFRKILRCLFFDKSYSVTELRKEVREMSYDELIETWRTEKLFGLESVNDVRVRFVEHELFKIVRGINQTGLRSNDNSNKNEN